MCKWSWNKTKQKTHRLLILQQQNLHDIYINLPSPAVTIEGLEINLYHATLYMGLTFSEDRVAMVRASPVLRATL